MRITPIVFVVLLWVLASIATALYALNTQPTGGHWQLCYQKD